MRSRSLAFCQLLLGLLLIFPTASVYAVSINLFPSSLSVPVGSPFSVEIRVSDLGNGSAPSLRFWDVDAEFARPPIYSFQGVTFGDPVLGNQLALQVPSSKVVDLVNLPSPTPILFLAETSNDTDAVLNSSQPGAFTLATITYDTFAVGTTEVGLVPNAFELTDGTQGVCSGFGGSDCGGNSVVKVQVTPEPSTFLLLGSGLVGLAAWRWRNARKGTN